MTTIPDDKLLEHACRLKDKVVVITGAANGIGKEAATRCASFGAKVVIGDLDVASAQKTVKDIESRGGQAVYLKCDVTNWDDQVAMFDLALSRFHSVDIVIPNAGISEIGTFYAVAFDKGKPVKPSLKTLEVNLIGVLYTTHLAMHYLKLNRIHDSPKALVLLGSMASWTSIPRGSLYSASKHAVLGLMRSLSPEFEANNIRIGSIHPFFADTGILPLVVKIFLAGIPFTPVSRIAATIIHVATNPDPATNGSAWLLTDDGPAFMVPKEEFKLGVYKMIDDRKNRMLKIAKGVTFYGRLFYTLMVYFAGIPLIVGGILISKMVWQI